MKDKTLQTYCGGQIALVQETLSDDSYVYSVRFFGEDHSLVYDESRRNYGQSIPCKSEKDAILLCEAFEKHTI